ELRPKVPSVTDYVFLDGEGFSGSLRWDEIAIPDGSTEAVAQAETLVQPEDVAVILYTSGTTGAPKGATLTHQSIIASGHAQAMHLEQTSADVTIGHMPLNHVGGLTCTVTASMVVGGQVALLPRYSPALALQTVQEKSVSIFVGVPTMYRMMMDLPD